MHVCSITERERKSYLDTISYWKNKSYRQGHVIAATLDLLLANGDKNCDNDNAIYELFKNHLNEEIKILNDRKKQIQDENN